MLDDSDLTPSAYRLYGHIKRVAGDNEVCAESTRQMAGKCRMSIGMVSEAKKELLDAGLIHIVGRGAYGKDIIQPVNIWPQNYEKYANRSHSEHVHENEDRSPESNRSHSEQNRSQYEQDDRTRSHYERIKKEHNTTSAKAEVSASDDAAPPQPTGKPPKPKQPRAPTAYINPDTGVSTADIKAAYLKALSHAEPKAVVNHGEMGNAAKKLAQAGWKPEEVNTCFWQLKREKFWEGRHLSLSSIASQIAATLNGKEAVRQSPNGSQPSYKKLKVLG